MNFQAISVVTSYKVPLTAMKFILKYRNEIVSFGLLPIIFTLIGLHFFSAPNILGAGMLLNTVFLLYGLFYRRELNFFLLSGCIAIACCYFLRFFTGYNLLPEWTLTPTIEFFLLTISFIHLTAPELYLNILRRLKLNTRFSYTFEAKIIVIFSALHLACLGILRTNDDGILFLSENRFFFIYIIPTAIYILCIAINITGMRIAARETIIRYDVIRIAPLCNGKIFLAPHKIRKNEGNEKLWDIPVEKAFKGSLRCAEHRAGKLAKKILCAKTGNITCKHHNPRLIINYTATSACNHICNIRLYILPINEEDMINRSEGRFFSFDEIKRAPELFSPSLHKEFDSLQMAAETWQEYD